MNIFYKFCAHPKTKNLSVDDPRTTLVRRDIIKTKSFLRKIYSEWYTSIVSHLHKDQHILEIGSGAGFLKEFLPNVITSEIFPIPHVSLVTNACHLPLKNQSIDAIVMVDVLHHLPHADLFFQEATRCVRSQGKIIMIEPWYTPWSKWIYTYFHPEPFEPNAGWEVPNTGPLSGANGALPWIIFQRDRSLFEAKYPHWQIKKIELMMPFSYLLSGGVSMRSFMPGVMYRIIRRMEKLFHQHHWAMFALIELEYTGK